MREKIKEKAHWSSWAANKIIGTIIIHRQPSWSVRKAQTQAVSLSAQKEADLGSSCVPLPDSSPHNLGADLGLRLRLIAAQGSAAALEGIARCGLGFEPFELSWNGEQEGRRA